MVLNQIALKIKRFYLASLVLLGVIWILDVPIRLNLGIVTASYISIMLAISIAAGFLSKPFNKDNSLIALDIGLGILAILSWGWVSINYIDWLTDLANRGPEKWLPGIIAITLLIEALRRFLSLIHI